MRKEYLVVYLDKNKNLVDEKHFQAYDNEHLEEMAERYMRQNKSSWPNGIFCWRAYKNH